MLERDSSTNCDGLERDSPPGWHWKGSKVSRFWIHRKLLASSRRKWVEGWDGNSALFFFSIFLQWGILIDNVCFSSWRSIFKLSFTYFHLYIYIDTYRYAWILIIVRTCWTVGYTTIWKLHPGFVTCVNILLNHEQNMKMTWPQEIALYKRKHETNMTLDPDFIAHGMKKSVQKWYTISLIIL